MRFDLVTEVEVSKRVTDFMASRLLSRPVSPGSGYSDEYGFHALKPDHSRIVPANAGTNNMPHLYRT